MKINFSDPACRDTSNKKRFGLCDDNPGKRAYINEKDGSKWIAVVENDRQHEVTFTAIDNCIETKKADGKMDKRCDGYLSYYSTVIFVELKEAGDKGNTWVKDGDVQLRASLSHFGDESAGNYSNRRAYISNKKHPKFKESQAGRMARFFKETGFVLRIENRIILD